jgi:hypothetical protein
MAGAFKGELDQSDGVSRSSAIRAAATSRAVTAAWLNMNNRWT